MKQSVFIILIIMIRSNYIFAQIPSLPTVQPPTINRYDNFISGKNTPSIPSSSYSVIKPVSSSIYDPRGQSHINQTNQAIVDEAVAYMQQQQETAFMLINHGFPSWQAYPGTEFFRSAFKELHDMLTGSSPMNLNRAVFLIENAYLENRLNYDDFLQKVDEKVQLCYWRLKDLKLDSNDPTVRNMVIFSLLTDTLKINIPGGEKTVTHYPLKYNLDDYQSQQDFTSHFVTTLLTTNTGQCYSMPLLYLLMAEKMNVEAYLAFAPRHSFIKVKDKNGAWHNLELTCRSILSDYHYMNHSYIKSEAIRNKLYLNPLSKQEVIADMMVQLGRYFLMKYGYDPFVLQCTTMARQYFPASVEAIVIEAHYQTRLTLEIGRLLNAPNPDVMKQLSPQAYEHYERMHALYKEMDDLGHESLPPEIYRNWLNHIAREKEKEAGSAPLLKMLQ